MTFNILISDPLSEDGIFPLRQAEGFNIVIDTTLNSRTTWRKNW